MRETAAAYKYRFFALLLIVLVLLRETHLEYSEIINIGKCYDCVCQRVSDEYTPIAASAHSTADTFECVEYTIVRDACTRELLDASQNRILNETFRSMTVRRRLSLYSSLFADYAGLENI